MAKTKRAPLKKPRGENWDTIHDNLRMLARRVVTAEGSLDDIQAVYAAMKVAKHYSEIASASYVANKLILEDKARRKGAE